MAAADLDLSKDTTFVSLFKAWCKSSYMGYLGIVNVVMHKQEWMAWKFPQKLLTLELQHEGCIMLQHTDSDCKGSLWICSMMISGMYFSRTWQHLVVGSCSIWWFELPSNAFTLKSIINQPFPLPPTAPLRSETYWVAKSMSNMHLNALLFWRFIWYVLHVTLKHNSMLSNSISLGQCLISTEQMHCFTVKQKTFEIGELFLYILKSKSGYSHDILFSFGFTEVRQQMSIMPSTLNWMLKGQ